MIIDKRIIVIDKSIIQIAYISMQNVNTCL